MIFVAIWVDQLDRQSRSNKQQEASGARAALERSEQYAPVQPAGTSAAATPRERPATASVRPRRCWCRSSAVRQSQTATYRDSSNAQRQRTRRRARRAHAAPRSASTAPAERQPSRPAKRHVRDEPATRRTATLANADAAVRRADILPAAVSCLTEASAALRAPARGFCNDCAASRLAMLPRPVAAQCLAPSR